MALKLFILKFEPSKKHVHLIHHASKILTNLSHCDINFEGAHITIFENLRALFSIHIKITVNL